MNTYICESELDFHTIRAGLNNGQLEAWRRDAEGRLWYRCIKAIYAVPPASIYGTEIDVEGDDVDG
jgi:hypothetical protein